MKGVALLALVIVLGTAGGILLVSGQWWPGALTVLVGVPAVSFFDSWLVRYRELKHRDVLVRKVVSETLSWGATTVPTISLVAALGTPDVMAAHEEARAKEDELWQRRNRSER